MRTAVISNVTLKESETKNIEKITGLIALSALITVLICLHSEIILDALQGKMGIALWITIPAVIIMAIIVIYKKDNSVSSVSCSVMEIIMSVLLGVAWSLAFLAMGFTNNYMFMITSLIFVGTYFIVAALFLQGRAYKGKLAASIIITAAALFFMAKKMTLTGYGIAFGIGGIIVSAFAVFHNYESSFKYDRPLYTIAEIVIGAGIVGFILIAWQAILGIAFGIFFLGGAGSEDDDDEDDLFLF